MTYDWEGIRTRRVRWMKVAISAAAIIAVLIAVLAQA